MLYTSFYNRANPKQGKREGIVLLIVIAMLTLFAVVGLAFVFYAEAEAVSTSVTVQGQSKTLPDADPELLLSYFLSQLIYDTTNVNSAMRGHSMARTMYGFNPPSAANLNVLNYSAYSGIGRIHNSPNVLGLDDFYSVNYQYYPNDPFPQRTPEFIGAGYRAGNAPYTYPDLNSMLLAQVAADGSVITPSFRRKWAEMASGASANPNLAKYVMLIPDANYHVNFSPPDVDAGGHVKNLDNSPGTKLPGGGYANNDSWWLDLGWPVMTAPNGKKYKALFAPLIVDLDNRLNMMVSGNTRNAGAHISNKGYGPTEINPWGTNLVVLNPATPTKDGTWLLGNRTLSANPPTWPFRDGPTYGRIDFDGINAGPNPFGAVPGPFSIFPTYNSPWYSATETTNHPLAYNYLAAKYQADTANTQLSLRASQMEAILRLMGTGAPAVTSDLFRNMPNTFANTNPRARGLLTSLSTSLDRITAAPYITFNASNIPNPYQYNAGNYPTLIAALNSANASAGTGEFDANFRSTLVNRLRVNLNRLSNGQSYGTPPTMFQYDYPTPDANGFIDTTIVYTPSPSWATSAPWTYGQQFNYAQSARQQLALQIYKVLVLVTGAQDPNIQPPGMQINAPAQYKAARWLAQLAVNIVDYIDNDDFITPFPWDTVNGFWVYGTEQPRLVLNEAYAQFDNDLTDVLPNLQNAAATFYNVNCWAELINPFSNITDPYPLDGGKARLNVGTTPSAAYQIVVCQTGKTVPDTGLRDPANVAGSSIPTPAVGSPPWPAATATVQGIANVWPAGAQVSPVNGGFKDPAPPSGQGFYVVGPAPGNFLAANTYNNTAVLTRNPGFTTNTTSNGMAWKVAVPPDPATPPNVTMLLQRLACPYILPQPNPALPNYNPYVTIDYIENLATQDNRVVYNNASTVARPNENTYNTWGRIQPYAAAYLTTAARTWGLAQTTANVGQPANTFYTQNTPMTAAGPNTPFYWLTHLDRPLVNALELLHVSGFHPHELTQQFVTYNNAGIETAQYAHRAPWTNEPLSTNPASNFQGDQAMIFRALELLGVPSYLNGTARGGCVSGKININTLNEAEILLALCDPQAISNFKLADVSALLSPGFAGNLMQSRTPGDPTALPQPLPQGFPSRQDVPFKSFATAWDTGDIQYPNGGSGIRDTLLRNFTSGATTQPLFWTAIPPNHPYLKWEMLQKIYNNLTTTSNVFAVWVTVGFFEVDDTFTPPKIGAEIGRDQGRQIRHRMFSIVDRSQLTLFSTTAGAFTINPTAGQPTTVPVKATNGNLANGNPWSIQPGMLLELGSPGNSEVVVVQSVNAGISFTAVFNSSYPVGSPGIWPANTPVLCRGNPGPQLTYNPRSDPLVVPHFTIIK